MIRTELNLQCFKYILYVYMYNLNRLYNFNYHRGTILSRGNV